MKLKKNRIVIGRKDIADFRSLGLFGIEVKVDSGAYTSSFHCHKIERFEKNGKDWVKCNFLDPGHPHYHEREFCFEINKVRRVKSSNGQVEERIAIRTGIFIFNREFSIELTLTERADMKYPVLLGRKFISKKFLIDTSLKNLSFRSKIMSVNLGNRNQ